MEIKYKGNMARIWRKRIEGVDNCLESSSQDFGWSTCFRSVSLYFGEGYHVNNDALYSTIYTCMVSWSCLSSNRNRRDASGEESALRWIEFCRAGHGRGFSTVSNPF
jgi:hypothetical protein